MNEITLTMTDVALALLLSARIYRTDAAVRTTAKRCAKYLPRSERQLLYTIVSSRNPLEIVATLGTLLTERQACE